MRAVLGLACLHALWPLLIAFASQTFAEQPAPALLLALAEALQAALALAAALRERRPPQRNSSSRDDASAAAGAYSPLAGGAAAAARPPQLLVVCCASDAGSPARTPDQGLRPGSGRATPVLAGAGGGLDTPCTPRAWGKAAGGLLTPGGGGKKPPHARTPGGGGSAAGCCSASSGGRQLLLAVPPWARGAVLLVLPALARAAAGNAALAALGMAPPYAFTLMAALDVAAAALLGHWLLGERLNAASQAAVATLLVGVCLGQTSSGGAAPQLPQEALALPAAVASGGGPAAAQAGAGGQAAALLACLPSLGLMAAAALLSAGTGAYLQWLAPQGAGGGRQSARLLQQAQLAALAAAANAAVWGMRGGVELPWLLDGMRPAHWAAAAALAGVGVLSDQVVRAASQQPGGAAAQPDAAVALAYGRALAVVLAAWGSSLALQQPPPLGFLLGALLVIAAVVQLHCSRLPPLLPHRQGGSEPGGGWAAALFVEQALRPLTGAARLRELRVARGSARARLAAATGLLLLVGLSSCGRRSPLSHSMHLSREALAGAGLDAAALLATTDAPMPAAALHEASMRVLAGGAAAARQAGGQAAPSAAASSAWALCPALACSSDDACSPGNATCCSHVFTHMLAFLDTFLHAHGLGSEYMLVYDTLLDAVREHVVPPKARALDVGLSARAVTALEHDGLKAALWRHGYLLFFDSHAWRLCAHRHHPSRVFQSLMRPAEHLEPQAGGVISFQLMWTAPPGQREQQQPQGQQGQLQGQLQGRGQQEQEQEQDRSLGLLARLLPGSALRWQLCPSDALLSTRLHRHASVSSLRFPIPDSAEEHLARVFGPGWQDPTHLMAEALDVVDEPVLGASPSAADAGGECARRTALLAATLARGAWRPPARGAAAGRG